MFRLGRLGALGVASPHLTPAWVLGGAAIDLDFQHGRSFGVPPAGVAIARASLGYADDSFGNWLPFAANVLRRTDKGLMIEEGRTNGIRNNSAQGIVVGTVGAGGAFPTNWENFSASNGIACSILGAGTELAVDYVDIRFQGTANVTEQPEACV